MKVCNKCENEIYTKDGENTCEPCERKNQKRIARNAAAKYRREVYKSLGLIRVRGSLGGTYYE